MKITPKQLIYLFLVILRIYLTISPEFGYIQPDEFFQSTEPIAGDVFQTKVYLPWEFNTTFPLRNIAFPHLISWPVFSLIKSFDLSDCSWLLLVAPRLVITLMSFICDWCLYKICINCKTKPIGPLLIFSSSYITLTYLTRTFSNSIETILLSLLVMNVVKSIDVKPKSELFSNTNSIGIVLALGFFNRPTFLAFAFVPIIFWLISNTKSPIQSFFIRGFSLAPSFIITSIILSLTDTLYFSDLNINDIIELISKNHWEQLFKTIVLTPLNFAKYNLRTSNLEKHGLHPPYFHLLVSIPFNFSLMGILAYYDLIKSTMNTFRRKIINENKYKILLTLTFIIPVVGLSLVPHQEPRFLIALILPLSLLYGNKLLSSKLLMTIWILFNLFLTVFYGFIHQAGVTKGLFTLNDMIANENEAHLIFSRMYLPPRYLLNIKSSSNNIHIYDLSIEPLTQLKNTLSQLKNAKNIYLLAPNCISNQINSLFTDFKVQNKLISQFFPHFTFEDLQSSVSLLKTSIWNVNEAFNMNLWKLNSN